MKANSPNESDETEDDADADADEEPRSPTSLMDGDEEDEDEDAEKKGQGKEGDAGNSLLDLFEEEDEVNVQLETLTSWVEEIEAQELAAELTAFMGELQKL